MADRILIVVPTRNRPLNVKRFWNSYRRTTNGMSDVVLVCDDDDVNDYSYTGFIIDRGPRVSVIEKINNGIKNHLGNHRVIGFLGDDCTCDTKDFEKIILEELQYRFGMLRPSNGFDSADHPDHVFITSTLYKFIGWFAYPKIEHTFIDYVWRDIANILLTTRSGHYKDCRNVRFTHYHPYYFPDVKYDELYKLVYDEERNMNDRLAYEAWTWDERKTLMTRLENVVDLLMITHDRVEYLKLSLESLLAQRGAEFMLTIWDNASQKKTLDYLDTINDYRIRIIKNLTNDSIANVVGKIFTESRRKYIGKVDPDTLLPSDWLKRCIEAHEKYEFGVIGGFHFRPEDLDGLKPNIEDFNGVKLWRKPYIGGCAFIMRRSLFKRYEGSGLFGFTEYQQMLDGRYPNGYLWDPILYVEHMEDSRSPFCIKNSEYEKYKMDTRNMSIDECTYAMYKNNPYLRFNT